MGSEKIGEIASGAHRSAIKPRPHPIRQQEPPLLPQQIDLSEPCHDSGGRSITGRNPELTVRDTNRCSVIELAAPGLLESYQNYGRGSREVREHRHGQYFILVAIHLRIDSPSPT
ncbi:hypothetical protein Bbelb_337710 [Branchiostoma belcheri]|nr:hypothetical protein Bbelb_337710 [Branchiostoma belcheri]